MDVIPVSKSVRKRIGINVKQIGTQNQPDLFVLCNLLTATQKHTQIEITPPKKAKIHLTIKSVFDHRFICSSDNNVNSSKKPID